VNTGRGLRGERRLRTPGALGGQRPKANFRRMEPEVSRTSRLFESATAPCSLEHDRTSVVRKRRCTNNASNATMGSFLSHFNRDHRREESSARSWSSCHVGVGHPSNRRVGIREKTLVERGSLGQGKSIALAGEAASMRASCAAGSNRLSVWMYRCTRRRSVTSAEGRVG